MRFKILTFVILGLVALFLVVFSFSGSKGIVVQESYPYTSLSGPVKNNGLEICSEYPYTSLSGPRNGIVVQESYPYTSL